SPRSSAIAACRSSRFLPVTRSLSPLIWLSTLSLGSLSLPWILFASSRPMPWRTLTFCRAPDTVASPPPYSRQRPWMLRRVRLAPDALAPRDLLPRAGHVGLDVAELQAPGVDLPRDQARAQDVGHLLQLELAGRGLGDHRVLAHELRVHALEVEAVGQLAVGLVDGVDQLVGVDFGNDIEGRHGRFRSRGWVRGRSTSRRARTGYSMVTHATDARGVARP